MRSSLALCRCLPVVLAMATALVPGVPAHASEPHAKNGSVILRMCKSADRVKSLSVMCHSYLDGYIDASMHHGKGRPPFCLGDADRKRASGAVVAWIEAHPESLNQPAVEVLQKALAEAFPCKGRT